MEMKYSVRYLMLVAFSAFALGIAFGLSIRVVRWPVVMDTGGRGEEAAVGATIAASGGTQINGATVTGGSGGAGNSPITARCAPDVDTRSYPCFVYEKNADGTTTVKTFGWAKQ